MTPAPQPLLRMPIAAEVSLVPLATVGALLGLHTDGVFELVDQGEWPWVFDLRAGKGRIRELRVWRGCLGKAEGGARKAELTAVLADVIGTTTGDVRGAALETRWQVSNQTFRRLLKAGEISGRIAGHTLWLQRESLAAFLERRRA
jgi:hypothetical protein